MTRHERNVGIASFIGILIIVTLAIITFSCLSVENVLQGDSTNTVNTQYSDQIQCISDNKKLLSDLRKDSTLPSRERLLRVQYTKSKISKCREELPRYIRYRDLDSTNTKH